MEKLLFQVQVNVRVRVGYSVALFVVQYKTTPHGLLLSYHMTHTFIFKKGNFCKIRLIFVPWVAILSLTFVDLMLCSMHSAIRINLHRITTYTAVLYC